MALTILCVMTGDFVPETEWFCKIGEKYYLINSEGVQIGDEYDAVSPFCHPVPRLLCRQENGDLSLQKEIRF